MWRTYNCFALLLILLAGCQGGLKRAAVSGQVLVDREPLAEGKIDFYPTEVTEGPMVGAVIKNGHYSIPAADGVIVGKNRVVIIGFRKSGRKIDDIWEKGKKIDEMERAVPPEYNEKSTLVRDIQAGKNTLDFDLPGIKGRSSAW